MKVVRWLLVLACVVLLASAALHSIGASFVFPALDRSDLRPELRQALKAMWLLFSVELLSLGVLAGWLARRPITMLIWICLFATALSTAVGLFYAGVFIGTELLILASVLLLAAALMQMRNTAGAPNL